MYCHRMDIALLDAWSYHVWRRDTHAPRRNTARLTRIRHSDSRAPRGHATRATEGSGQGALPKQPRLAQRGRGARCREPEGMQRPEARPRGGDDEGRAGKGASESDERGRGAGKSGSERANQWDMSGEGRHKGESHREAHPHEPPA